jgi:uncharacterized membrane protein YeaQ/YmgE (transglycosylase-associated protein family)
MSLIVYIILGGLVGWLAARLLGREEGILASILIGIVGSFIGSFISRLITGSDKSYLAFSWSGLVWSLVGAIAFVAVMNAISRPRRHII